MFGKTTTGIVVDNFTEFLSEVGGWLQDVDEDEIDQIKEIGKAIQNLQTDDMGKQIIIY